MKTTTVCFYTYTPSLDHPRHQYSITCLKSLMKNLTFKEGELKWHIADDGSPPEHVEELIKESKNFNVSPTVSDSHRLGYGGNVNIAAQAVHSSSDFVLACEEDWELVRPLDISLLARALEESEELNCIRLGYLGITNEMIGTVKFIANQTFLVFDPNCSETFIFTGHPRLEKVSYEQAIGAWPEGLKAGYTELEICKLPAARKGVAWPLDAGINASQDYCTGFAHIGGVQA